MEEVSDTPKDQYAHIKHYVRTGLIKMVKYRQRWRTLRSYCWQMAMLFSRSYSWHCLFNNRTAVWLIFTFPNSFCCCCNLEVNLLTILLLWRSLIIIIIALILTMNSNLTSMVHVGQGYVTCGLSLDVSVSRRSQDTLPRSDLRQIGKCQLGLSLGINDLGLGIGIWQLGLVHILGVSAGDMHIQDLEIYTGDY